MKYSKLGNLFLLWTVLLYPISRLYLPYKVHFISIVTLTFVLVSLYTLKNSISALLSSSAAAYILILSPLVSVLGSIQFSTSAFKASLMFCYAGLFTIALITAYEGGWKSIKLISEGGIWLIAILAIGILIKHGSLRPSNVSGTSNLPSIGNKIGAVVLPYLPIVLAVYRKQVMRHLWYLSVVSIIVVLTQSRAAYGILAFIILAHAYNDIKRTGIFKTILYYASIMLPATVVSIIIIPSDIYVDVWNRTASLIETDTVGVLRETAWGDWLRIKMITEIPIIFKDNPISGIGFDTYSIYLDDKYGYAYSSHTIFSTIIAEMGMVGVTSFTLLIISIRSRLKTIKELAKTSYESRLGRALTISVVVILLHWLVRPQIPNPTIYIIVGTLFGISYRVAKNVNK